MLNLNQNELKIVKDILQRHIPSYRVVVFGSRIKNTAKKFSDLDLCIMGDKELSLKQTGDLKEDFSESDLPFRVDVVEWNAIDSEFQKIIEKNYEEIQHPSPAK